MSNSTPPPSSASSSAAISVSSSSSSPSSSSTSVSTVNDLLASLSDSASSYHASLSAPVAAEVLRLREMDRHKLDQIIKLIPIQTTTAQEVISVLNGVFITTKAALFLDLSYRFVVSDGLTLLCDWFEAAFHAWERDSARSETNDSSSSSPSSSTARVATIPPESTAELLRLVLRAWFRASVYQPERSRQALPTRPHLFSMLRTLLSHPNPEVVDLAHGLLLHYQPDSAAEVQALLPPSTAPSPADDAQPSGVSPPTSFTAAIRAEYELAKAAEEAQEQLLKEAQPALPSPSQTNGIEQPSTPPAPSSSSPVSPPAPVSPAQAATVATKVTPASSSSSSPRTARSPAPSVLVPTASPTLATADGPPSPLGGATFTAAHASLTCPICGECFTTDLSTYHHVMMMHHLALCVLCALGFPSEEQLYAHFETHNHVAEPADAPHACGLCGVSYTTEESLALHHQVHVVERKPRAQYNKRKRKGTNAIEERQSPTKKGDEASASGDAQLKKKAKVDEDADAGDDGGDDEGGGGPSRFPPAICSHPSHPEALAFASDEDLQAHSIAAHVTYQCFATDCESSFSSAQQLAQHLITAHVETSRDMPPGGGIPPHCSYCGVIWTKKTPRTEHLHRHEKPFHCAVCGMRFARRTRWRNHAKRKHPEQLKAYPSIFDSGRG